MKYGFKDTKEKEILRGHIKAGGKDNKGGSIEVNSLYFEKDGKPWLPVMGEYHFQRDNKENWRTELLKMKAGGVSIVATYLLWIYCEEEKDKWNFEGDNDLRAFLKTVSEVGMYCFLRVGPWAHGECRNGGFPDWLNNQKDFKLRDNNPEYLKYVREWYTKIYDNCHEFFYKDGGPVIGVQIENELVDNAEHILTLKNMAMEIGFDVPMFTATGWNARFGAKLPLDEVLPVFGAYADAPWDEKISELPLSPHYAFHTERNDTGIGVDLIKDKSQDGYSLPYDRYPFATCEIGPGMQSTHHRRVIMAGIDAYAMSLCKLGVGNNLIGYYMYHGGVNKLGKLSTFNEDKATGYPNDYTNISYDFGTCISQYGEIREQYRLLNLLHMFVNDFGDLLAPMQHVGAEKFVDENNSADLRYCMRAKNGSGFIFVNNYQRHGKTTEQKNVSFDTGSVVFPEITVKEGECFILPFNLKLGNVTLKYATAQLLCKDADTYYFMEIPGIKPEFAFEGGELKISVVSKDQARFMRKIDGKVYITDGDMYVDEGKVIPVIKKTADVKLTECKPAKVDFKPYEMSINGERKLTWYSLSVDSSEGEISIDMDDYDTAQIYADGVLVADNFNEWISWRVPAKLLKGKECYLVKSSLKDDYYINKDDVKRVRKER